MQAPFGYDQFGYSIRSRKGTVFHEGKGFTYTGRKSLRVGDVVGCLIHLPSINGGAYLPASHKDLPLIQFKRQYYVEKNYEPKAAAQKLQNLPGSRVSFRRNGHSTERHTQNYNNLD